MLWRLDQRMQLFSFMRYSRHALIRFDSDQHGASVRVGHRRKHADDFSSEILLAFFVALHATILVSADKFQELTALLFEQESDFFGLHGLERIIYRRCVF